MIPKNKSRSFYLVADIGPEKHFWWSGGDWTQEIGKKNASSNKKCRNFNSACHYARRLKYKGGAPLIARLGTKGQKRVYREWTW